MDILQIGQHVTAMAAELHNLKESDAAQKKEIEQLRAQNEYHANEAQVLRELRQLYENKLDQKDSEILGLHVFLDTWKEDAGLYRKQLTEVRKHLKDLQAEHESTLKQICATEAKVSRRDLQITKLVSTLRRKLATSRICLTALRAAYKIIPSLEQKAQYEKILSMAKNIPHSTGLQNEMNKCLEEVGFSVSFDNKGAMVLRQSVEVLKAPVDNPKELDEAIVIATKDAPKNGKIIDNISHNIDGNVDDKKVDKIAGPDAEQKAKQDEDMQMSI
ncbi:hypothetical protein FBEOM_69 [Fusarium beomiforme]|uniref:Uncharacterized protein n=1 Tax=Fusarium beomiforme TaxID=44412 RepID=A0A9P5E258_9HYPO|nr:hypothetical protein FBEOM_69 [Fusarium beomiforme]